MGSIDDVQIANAINPVIAILLVVYLKETIRKDLKILVKRGEIEAHQQKMVSGILRWYMVHSMDS